MIVPTESGSRLTADDPVKLSRIMIPATVMELQYRPCPQSFDTCWPSRPRFSTDTRPETYDSFTNFRTLKNLEWKQTEQLTSRLTSQRGDGSNLMHQPRDRPQRDLSGRSDQAISIWRRCVILYRSSVTILTEGEPSCGSFFRAN
ncbi:hypothetical protein LIA77_11902 [Sarocladium implicatum]|nr:hypothetical protein LIA77_11902 [Sarocladium implicatum]